MLLSSLGTSITNVALPVMVEAFDVSFQAIQWVVLIYLLAITTLIVSVGRLGDLTGRRRLLIVGILLFTMASATCGMAPTLWLLLAARAAQGFGAAIMMALTLAFIGEVVAKERAGRAMGLLGTMSAVGTALGPSLGGFLVAGFGWPAIFFVNVPLGIFALILAYRFLPADSRKPKAKPVAFDHLGTLLLALTLAAYALAMTLGRGHFGLLNIALLLVAILGVGLFVVAQARTKSPLIQVVLYRDPALSAGLIMSALVATVIMTTMVVGPFYLSGALGLGAAKVGLILSVGPLAAALTGLPAGRLTDRFGTQVITSIGLAGVLVGCLMLWVMPTRFGILSYVVPIVIVTVGYAMFQTANNTAVMANKRPDQRGVISGMLNLSRNLGLITGASVMGAVYAAASATSDVTTAHPHALTTGMQITFAVAGCITAVSLCIAWISHQLSLRTLILEPNRSTS
jgi:EmrB/QacA subfamily drug resistance transporter